MNYFKRINLGIVVIVLLLLVACDNNKESSGDDDKTSSDGDSKEVVTLEVWDYLDPDSPPEQEQLSLLSEYEENNPNIKFERTYFPFADLKTKLLQGVAGNDLPDIVIIDNPDHQSFSEAGVFADISEEVEKWGEADMYYDGPMDSAMLNGKYYGIPNNSNALALYYNKDIFEEAGISEPPKTWEELRETAKELTNEDHKGLAIAGVNSEEGTFQFLPYLWQAGADLDTFDSPEAVSAMQFIQDMVNEGSISENVINWDQDDVMTQFQNGGAAMMVNGPWHLPTLREEVEDINWDVGLMPEGNESASILGGENWAITSATENKEEAWEFLKWTQQPEVLGPAHELGGRLPNRSDVADDPSYEWNEDEQLQVFVNQIETARPRAYGANYPEISAIVQEAMQRAFTGEDVEKVMNDSAEEIEPLLP